MSHHARLILLVLSACVVGSCSDDGTAPTSPSPQPAFTFFVTSATSVTGNLGGIRGADATCQRLAIAVGAGRRTWRAYLGAESDPDSGNRPTNARDRIGSGPWFNVNLEMVAADLSQLHARTGDAAADEHGQRINGAWPNSPRPNEHDILTGSTAEGTLIPGMTCADWTSESAGLRTQVGHTDGLGGTAPGGGPLRSWNSAHMNQSGANTAPGGGAGRVYCFARRD